MHGKHNRQTPGLFQVMKGGDYMMTAVKANYDGTTFIPLTAIANEMTLVTHNTKHY